MYLHGKIHVSVYSFQGTRGNEKSLLNKHARLEEHFVFFFVTAVAVMLCDFINRFSESKLSKNDF